MQKLIKLLSRVRIKFRRSSSLTKTVVLSAVVLSLAALLTLHLTINATQAKTDALKDEAAQLEHENKELSDKIDNTGSADDAKEEAFDEGMVGENDIIITPNTGK